MSTRQNSPFCIAGGWGLALVAAIVALAVLMLGSGWSLVSGLFGALIVFIIAGSLLKWFVCGPKLDSAEQPAAMSSPQVSEVAEALDAPEESEAPAEPVEADDLPQAPAPVPSASGLVQPSKSLAGEIELASRKGTWSYLGAEAASETVKAESDPAPQMLDDGEPSDQVSDVSDDPKEDDVKASDTGSDAVKATAQLPGEAELAARKGEWTYRPSGQELEAPPAEVIEAEDVAAEPVVALDDAAADETAPVSDVPTDQEWDAIWSDADEDETALELEPGRPQPFFQARDDKPDDLRLIKGIGPKLETLCHTLGVFHFDQIASWTPEEIEWMDENLTGFRGRVTRDQWVPQAKILAEQLADNKSLSEEDS